MKTLVSWSTGKNSAWMLHVLRRQPGVELAGLVTTMNAAFDRVAMHGVRRTLLEAQADAAGLPLHVLPIPHPCPNEAYEAIMGEFIAGQAQQGVEAMAFGDLFLQDIRRLPRGPVCTPGLAGADAVVRQRHGVAGAGNAIRRPAGRTVLRGYAATSTDFAGRDFDAALLRELPAGVDPCGENGEFHTCVHAGPMLLPPRPGAWPARPSPAAASSSATLLPRPALARQAMPREVPLRIVSLIASATEIVHLLGETAQVGRSHECDWPEGVTTLPVCTRPRIDVHADSREIERQVREAPAPRSRSTRCSTTCSSACSPATSSPRLSARCAP